MYKTFYGSYAESFALQECIEKTLIYDR